MTWLQRLWNYFFGIGSGPAPVTPPVSPAKPPPSGGGNNPPDLVGGVSAMGDQGFMERTTPAPPNSFAQIRGLPGGFSAICLNYGWDALNPAPAAFDFSAIDADLATAASLGVPVEFRIASGQHVPDWVKAVAGSYTVPAQHGNETLTFAKYWLPDYQAALQAFQAALAAKYDGNPQLRCMWTMTNTSFSCEVFNIGVDKQSRLALAAAGATDALIRANISGLFADMAAWKLTPMGLPVEMLYSIENLTTPPDITFPQQIGQQAIATWGNARCVLANMAVNPNATGDGKYNDELVRWLPTLGVYTACQIANPTSDQSAGAAYAGSLGYNEIQEWESTATGGHAAYTAADLAAWDKLLKPWLFQSS